MPDDAVLDGLRRDSIAALGSYIETLPGARELQLFQVKAYEDREFLLGWCVPFAFNDRIRNFHVLIGPSFPFEAPRIALVDRPAFLSWPHVERDGVLCILQSNSNVSARDPIGVFQNLFARAVRLVDDSSGGANVIDFETEFNTYWNYKVDGQSDACRSLISLGIRNRIIRLWRGHGFDIIADDEASIKDWLAHRYPKSQITYTSGTAGRAGLIWLPRALVPQEYPMTAHALLAITKTAGEMGMVAELVDEATGDVRIILAAPTTNGPVLAGVAVPNPRIKDVMGRKTDSVSRGFRPGHVPRSLRASRFLGSGTRVMRFAVARIDHDWIHGRGRDTRQATLKTKSVVVLGCGSVGSAVAVSLAKSGIGKLMLVDNEKLNWPNTSRHSLGAASVGLNKATALAQDLQVNYPHLEIIGQDISVGGALRASPGFLSADLIISLTANWGMDQALTMWRKGRDKRPKLIYGWTESHACAGHAVFTGESSCIECGYDPTGLPLFSVTEWPESQDLQEPACGAAFQPYGGIEVSNTVTLIAGLVLDSLLRANESPIHRFWAGPKSLLLSSGGRWSRQWANHPEFRDLGSVVVEQPWPPEVPCANCGGIDD